MPKVEKRKYWYRLYICYCPVCGRSRETRYRVYEKPTSYYDYNESWDYCDAY